MFTGTTTGVVNMRAGNGTRLHGRLTERGEVLAGFDSTGYCDSINDLPLLEAVNTPVVVHADVRLAAIAAERGWKTLQLR